MNSYILAVAVAFATSTPLRAADASKTSEESKETKGEYVKRAHAAIDALGVKIDALEAKAKDAGAEARVGMDEKLKALKARRKTAKKDLAKLKRASGKAWNNLKAGVDKGIDDLKTAYDEAAAG